MYLIERKQRDAKYENVEKRRKKRGLERI